MVFYCVLLFEKYPQQEEENNLFVNVRIPIYSENVIMLQSFQTVAILNNQNGARISTVFLKESEFFNEEITTYIIC